MKKINFIFVIATLVVVSFFILVPMYYLELELKISVALIQGFMTGIIFEILRLKYFKYSVIRLKKYMIGIVMSEFFMALMLTLIIVSFTKLVMMMAMHIDLRITGIWAYLCIIFGIVCSFIMSSIYRSKVFWYKLKHSSPIIFRIHFHGGSDEKE